MSRSLIPVALLFLIVSTASAGELVRAATPIPGSYIVVLKDQAGPSISAAGELLRFEDGELVHRYDAATKGFAFRGSEAAALRISSDPRVAYVQEDSILRLADFTPSWGLDRIDQRDRPLDDNYAFSATGAGTVLYIIDSGVNPIGDLAGRIRAQRNFSPTGGVVNPNDTADCAGHGTLVAGVAAGTMFGVAKDAQLVNLRVLDCANRYSSSSIVIAAIDWMIVDHGSRPGEPAVANLSLVSDGVDPALDGAVLHAMAIGITVVLAAGNDNVDACTRSPARVGTTNVITVGATTINDEKATFSNFGPCVDLWAPGDDVMAMSAFGAVLRGLRGTSFAAPYVAGVAAKHLQTLQLSDQPDTIESLLKAAATRDRLQFLGTGSPNLLLYSMIPRRRS